MSSYSQVVQEVRNAYKSGKTRSLEFRKRQLRALQRMYEENVEAFVSALAKDLRKPRQEAVLMEICVLTNDLIYILNNIDEWSKDETMPCNLVTMFDKGIIYHEPYGVVLCLGAWNYPLQLSLLPVSGAIAAGNAVIIKPSEVSPATAELIAKLLPLYLDKECFRVICGGIPETTELLKERFDYIFYTGSPSIGRIIYQAANKYLTPVTLELGGKSPVYMDDTVDMDIAVRRIVWGKCVNAGQTCIAPDYLLCSKDVQVAFLAKAKEVLKEWYGEDKEKSLDLARIVTDRHVTRLSEYLKEGTIAIGGKVVKEDKFIEPTVLVDVPTDAKVLNEEIFGPILPIVNVNSPKEAIDYINSRDPPLACYVFTSDCKVWNEFVISTPSGTSCVNDVIIHNGMNELPFGGIGNSGMGAYHGKASYDTFTHRKPCLIRNYNKIADFIGANRYPPYSDSKTKFLANMLKVRWMPSLRFLSHAVVFCAGVLSLFVVQNMRKAGKMEDE